LVRDARERMDAIPGVVASASAVSLPLDGGGHMLSFTALGRPTGKGQPNTGATEWTAVSPGYFDVFRIPIIRGRAFNEGDTEAAPPVVIINQAMATIFWPKENPIGQQIVIGKAMGPVFADQPRLIIGVVGDIRADGLNTIPPPLMVTPQAQVPDKMNALINSTESIHWLLRTNSEPHQAASAVEDQLRQASGGLPTARVRTMDEILAQSTARQNFNMQLLSIFGASALILAAIGIYGLITYSVQQRVQEIGVRMALGADRSRIRNMVVWQGMRLVIIGVLIGTGAALALTHLIAGFLFGVKSWDPTIFVIVQVLLSFVALLAVWMPAQRGARLDPMQALRME
jgi:putative ABC transport system permease protein